MKTNCLEKDTSGRGRIHGKSLFNQETNSHLTVTKFSSWGRVPTSSNQFLFYCPQRSCARHLSFCSQWECVSQHAQGQTPPWVPPPKQKFSYNEHPANTSTILCIKLLAVCRTHCSDGFLSTIRPGWELESQRTADWTTETKTGLFLIIPHLYINW